MPLDIMQCRMQKIFVPEEELIASVTEHSQYHKIAESRAKGLTTVTIVGLNVQPIRSGDFLGSDMISF